MMHISPARETARQRLTRIADATTGVLILVAIGVISGVSGALMVLLVRGAM